MPFIDVDQRDVEWLKMRTGCATASRCHEIIAKLKVASKSGPAGSYKACRRDYMIELICERLTGRASEHFVSDWMQRGQDDEMLALAAYEAQSDEAVENGGFYLHDSIEYYGASPDARIGDKGLLELKNLKPERHYEILRGGIIPAEFITQMDAQLSCAPERDWVDYGSYCKEMLSPKLRLFIRRHYRNAERIAALEAEVRKYDYLAAELMALAETAKPAV